MFDIGGFLTSTEFLGQLAMLITAFLSTMLGELGRRLFGVGI